MQNLARTSTGGASWQAFQVVNALNYHNLGYGPVQQMTWKFTQYHYVNGVTNRLDPTTYHQNDITAFVVGCEITHDTARAVHRTCTLTMADTVASQTVTLQGNVVTEAGLDYNNDLVKVTCRIGALPGQGPSVGDWLEFDCGIFMFTQPQIIMSGYAVARQATLLDLTHIVERAQATSNGIGAPLAMPQNTPLVDIARTLLSNPTIVPGGSGVPFDIYPSPDINNGVALGQLPGLGIPANRVGSSQYGWPSSADIDAKSSVNYTFPEGTNYLDIINQMLFWANCEDLWCDENGNYITSPKPNNGDYSTLPSSYTYDSTVDSIIDFGGTATLQLDNVPNIVQVIVEDPSGLQHFGKATNNLSSSPVSVAAVGPRVMTIRDSGVPTATSTDWAQTYAVNMLRKNSYMTEEVVLPISPNPAHQNLDVVTVNIFQQYVAAGNAHNWPIVTSLSTPNTSGTNSLGPLDATQKFVTVAYTLRANLPTPGAGSSLATSGGLSTQLEPHMSKAGHTMSLTLRRVTNLL